MKRFLKVLPDLELSSLCGSVADFYGSYPGCIEAGEAGGVHKFISGTTLYKSGEQRQASFSGWKQM